MVEVPSPANGPGIEATPDRGRRGLAASLGAIGAALLASLCCIGPVLLVTLGVGAGLAKLAERASNLDLKILGRDSNPDLMDSHLTGGSRSIPVVILLDETFIERAWWGPRPRDLQEWALGAVAVGVVHHRERRGLGHHRVAGALDARADRDVHIGAQAKAHVVRLAAEVRDG